MKKYLFGIFAIVMALGFSAFTNAKMESVDYFYFDGSLWQTVPSNIQVCDPGSSVQCELEIQGQDELIYTAKSFSSPYMRN
jgi:hypothetical protein